MLSLSIRFDGRLFYYCNLSGGMILRMYAKKAGWLCVEIKGVKVYLSDVRIDPKSVPRWMNQWELVYEDNHGIPCRYKPGILVNFYGMFLI